MLIIFLNVLAVGIIYSLIAIGYNVIYKTSRIINFAQGELVIAGGVLWVHLMQKFQMSSLTASFVASLCVALLSYLVYQCFLFFVKKNIEVNSILITLAYSTIIQALLGYFTSTDLMKTDTAVSSWYLNLSEQKISGQIFLIVGVTFIISMILNFIYKKTVFGIRMRAVSESWKISSLRAIYPKGYTSIVFAMSGVLAAVAGMLITPVNGIRYDQGFSFAIKGFAAMIIGGIGNIWGAFLGGILLAGFEAIATLYFSKVDSLIVYVLILCFLVFRPKGILGGKR